MPDVSVPTASGDWVTTKATYNFWQSPRIEPEDIREAHQLSTFDRVKEHNIILAIQDTTDLNFTHHPSKKGMGPIGQEPYVQGLLVHSVLAVSSQGVPLGVLHQQIWA